MPTYQKLKQTLIYLLAPAGALLAQSSPITETNFNAPVDFPAALKIAVERDPRLLAMEAKREAALGGVVQADLKPNPVIGGEFENALGTGPYNGVQGIEVTLGIRQLIETADKRSKRTTLAERELDLVAWQRENLLAAIEAETREAFIAVLLAQKTVTLREEQLALAERSSVETQKLVDAARSPQVDLTRAKLEVKQQEFALQQARRTLLAARTALAAGWGLETVPEFSVTGEIVLEANLPEYHQLLASLSGSAMLAQFGAIARSREAALDLEQARAKPDFEVFAGSRYFNENDGDLGFVAGVEIPWPLFDKNQGNIQSARAELRSVEHQRNAARRALQVKLSRHFSQLTDAHADATAVQAELLPAAKQTLADTEAGYQRGQFRQLAVLESRQTLFKIRESYLDALSRYAQAQSAISALTRQSTIN